MPGTEAGLDISAITIGGVYQKRMVKVIDYVALLVDAEIPGPGEKPGIGVLRAVSRYEKTFATDRQIQAVFRILQIALIEQLGNPGHFHPGTGNGVAYPSDGIIVNVGKLRTGTLESGSIGVGYVISGDGQQVLGSIETRYCSTEAHDGFLA